MWIYMAKEDIASVKGGKEWKQRRIVVMIDREESCVYDNSKHGKEISDHTNLVIWRSRSN